MVIMLLCRSIIQWPSTASNDQCCLFQRPSFSCLWLGTPRRTSDSRVRGLCSSGANWMLFAPLGASCCKYFNAFVMHAKQHRNKKKSHPFFRVSTEKSTSRPWQALCHKLHLTNHVGNCWHRAHWDWSSVGEDIADVVKKNRFDFVIMTEKITFRNKFAKLLRSCSLFCDG